MYITISDYQTYIWRTLSVTETATITALIAQTKYMIDRITWPLDQDDRDFDIDFSYAYMKSGIVEIEFKTNNITIVKKVNWLSYTWGYKIIWKRSQIVQFFDINQVLNSWNEWYTSFKVNVTCWYSTIPDDIKLANMIMVQTLANPQRIWVKNETTWPHKIEYTDQNMQFPDVVSSILSRYRSLI